MPTLLLVRHAQAQLFAGRDEERALTSDGVRTARMVGRMLAVTGTPDRAVVSTAWRARQTLDEAMDAGGWKAPVMPSDALYGGGAPDVLEAIADEAAGCATLLVVGHEPWCSGLVGLLTGAQLRMTTGALATMEVGPGWDALDPQWCTLTAFVPAWLARPLEDERRATGGLR